ncbi:MAG: MBOAT family protein [Methylococcaceae bacterium]|nr:MBOAT family protein [Methylococcaceae bacterium]
MLFNSHPFIFLYLPLTLLLFYWLGKRSREQAAAWLAFASLFFYAWWNWRYVLLLLASIGFNYLAGGSIARLAGNRRKILTTSAIVSNLGLLAYYKYANFFLTSLSPDWSLGEIVLPLGISFFTFTQIAYLADVHQGKVKEYHFIHYVLFVTYFPHLIAGPILHHQEMMPQFAKAETYRFSFDKLALGLTIFFIGLFKKTVLADGVAPGARALFDAAAQGQAVALMESWSGVLAYTLQLYFDFSGYSDMAIGLSCLFGIRLPLNFDSPYRATNIIEFWRRWHMSLSRFLRDYLYIPLGGNRHGKLRRHFNLLVTMLLGGLWHGANWTFVIWGGLHGLYLMINHAWRNLRERLGHDLSHSSWVGRLLGGALTFLAVMVAWVFFRSATVAVAQTILKGMAGLNGIVLPHEWLEQHRDSSLIHWLLSQGVSFIDTPLFDPSDLFWDGLLLAFCWLAPNTRQWFALHNPSIAPARTGASLPVRWQWRMNRLWAAYTVVIAYVAVISLSELSEFIYFQF